MTGCEGAQIPLDQAENVVSEKAACARTERVSNFCTRIPLISSSLNTACLL